MKFTDVHEDPTEGPEDPDSVGAVLQDVRNLHHRLLTFQVEGASRHVLLGCGRQPGTDVEDAIHVAGVEHIVGCEERRVERTVAHGVHQLVHEAVLAHGRCEHSRCAEVLIPDVGREIVPFRILRIRGR